MSTTGERTRLLAKPRSQSDAVANQAPRTSSFAEDAPESTSISATPSTIWQVVPLLLLGVFLANADTSLVVAASQKIASEFQSLADASWLITSYGLASCACQPLYGKLSDVFGRKSNLLVSYAIFAGGCTLCASGQTLWLVILGRALSGIGGAGVTALVSIVIADIVPLRQVASWRSYVNVVATGARALGAPLGGWLTDLVGWRMAFLIQVPLTVLAMVLVAWRLPGGMTKVEEAERLLWTKRLKRIDGLGALSLISVIVSLLLTLDLIAKEKPWWSVILSAGICLKMLFVFYYVEQYWAEEPVLPITLISQRDVWVPYLIALCQTAAQFGIFYAVPIFFQIASQASVRGTGLRMLPAVIGNTVGGIFTGLLLARTGRYKKLTVAGTMVAMAGYVLVLIRWAGSTKWFDILYLAPAGFGTGIIQSTTFVHLAASLNPEDMAIAGTGLYSVQTMGVLVGTQVVTTVLHAQLRATLESALQGFGGRAKIIKDALSDVSMIWDMPDEIRKIVTDAYVQSLRYAYGASILFSVVALLASLTIRERSV